MKKKIFYKVFAATLACVLLMFVFGIIAVNMNTNNIVNERFPNIFPRYRAYLQGRF